ncbi:MAG TPA: ATP synthase F1 subunit delta [Gemmataceae bacterium]|jgi:F-type H+-transporting ATPase subunit delta|nr:ATP synthase F1 subunit delta [Gemmataceae bacterium]
MSETAKPVQLPRESTFDRETQRIARVYAKAVLQAAAEHGQVVALQDEMQAFFNEVMPIDSTFATFFMSGALGRERRSEILQRVLVPYVSDLLGNLFMVLNAHERLDLFGAVAASYLALCEASAGRITVQVRTPSALTAPERDSLLKQLRQTLNQEASLEETVEPALLGGITLKIGDWLYDSSVRTRLQEIRKQLIARSSYEIQSGRDRFSTAD